MQTIREALTEGANQLCQAKIENASNESRLLLAYVLGYEPIWLRAHEEKKVFDDEMSQYRGLIRKRKEHMPFAYITGHKEFMSLDFVVTPDVLIPRPDTEILAEQAVSFCKSRKKRTVTVLDLCCGSGCIGISIAYYAHNTKVVMADLSADALHVAEENLKKYYLNGRVRVIRSNLFKQLRDQRFDLIVSNPPYISESEKNHLSAEIICYEPKTALFAGEDGLLFYEQIIPQSRDHLSKSGILMLEIGAEQTNDVMRFMKNNGFSDIRKVQDYAGLDRVLFGRKKDEEQ